MTNVLDRGAATTTLFGRDTDLLAVEGFLDASVRGAALVVAGDPGLGKTAIADAAAVRATARGFSIARARGDQFSPDAYSAVRALVGVHWQVNPPLTSAHREALAVALYDGTGPPPRQLALANALLEVLTSPPHSGPVLLVVDDLQWLDRASAGVLALAARRLAGRGIGFLGTLRPENSGFFDLVDLPQLVLRPLTADAARQTLEAHHPMLGAQVVSRVLNEAAGNPLALTELPTALTEAQRQQTEALPIVLPLTERLNAMFTARIAALPAATRRLLLLAALDDDVDVRLHLAATGLELEDLGAAENARLVSVDLQRHEIHFRHPLMRAAVVDLADAHEKRQAHETLAALQAGVSDRRARHLAAAATGPDEVVAKQLESVAHRLLRRGDGVGAVDALMHAANLSESPDRRRARLAAAAYLGVEVSGDLDLTAALLDAEPAVDMGAHSLQTAAAAAQLLLNGEGDVEMAHRLVAAALADADAAEPRNRGPILEALHTLQLINFFAGDAHRWASYRETLRGLPLPLPVALDVSGRTLSDPARLANDDWVLGRLDEAIGVVGTAAPSEVIRLAQAGIYVDRLSGLRGSLWQVAHDGRSGRAVASGINALMLLAFDSWFSGQWDETQVLATEGVELCEKHGYRLLVWPGQLALALVAAARGDTDTVARLTEQMLRWASPRGVHAVELYAWHARALGALTQGNAEQALECATRISPPGQLAANVPHALWLALDLVEAAVAAGHGELAAAHCAALGSNRVGSLSPRLGVVVAAARAIAAASSSAPLTEQKALFEAAVTHPGVERWPLEHARVQLAYGQMLRRELLLDDARPHLQSALRTFRGLGAEPWSLRAADALRASGIPQQARVTLGPAGLTEQEREVTALAASGLTNRQIGERLFLSHRTVGSVLYRAFPKLGVATRAALRDALSAEVD